LSLLTGGAIGSPVAAPPQQDGPARPSGEIENMKRQLGEVRQTEIELLSMFSEMRGPLCRVLGYTELILDAAYGEVPESVRFALQHIARNGVYATELINKVFDRSNLRRYGRFSAMLTE
jgi:hypothetical protein